MTLECRGIGVPLPPIVKFYDDSAPADGPNYPLSNLTGPYETTVLYMADEVVAFVRINQPVNQVKYNQYTCDMETTYKDYDLQFLSVYKMYEDMFGNSDGDGSQQEEEEEDEFDI